MHRCEGAIGQEGEGVHFTGVGVRDENETIHRADFQGSKFKGQRPRVRGSQSESHGK